MIRNIIFDFDGVLADTTELLYSIFKEVDPSISYEDFLSHHDGNVYLEPKIKFTENQVERVLLNYREKLDASHIESGKIIIKNIPRSAKLFIISSNDEEAIKSVLDESGTLNRFSAILGQQSGKSKVEKIKIVENEYNCSLHETIFITDTLGDIKEANCCGVACYAVSFGFHNKNRLRFGKPKAILSTLSDLIKVIKINTKPHSTGYKVNSKKRTLRH